MSLLWSNDSLHSNILAINNMKDKLQKHCVFIYSQHGNVLTMCINTAVLSVSVVYAVVTYIISSNILW